MMLGLVFLIAGTLFRCGKLRAYYWAVAIDYYRSAAYGLIPLGIALMLLGTARPFFDTIWITPLRIMAASCFLLNLFFFMFQPKFARPDWINWLEGNHSDILPELRYEMWRMGRQSREIMYNQKKLEAWIQDYRQKRGLQKHRVSRDVV